MNKELTPFSNNSPYTIQTTWNKGTQINGVVGMRLTSEDIKKSVSNKCICYGSRIVGKQFFAKMCNELIEYKNIEEQLGIDLITLFKALNVGVYYYKKRINFAKGYRIKLRISDKMLYIDKHTHLYFKDYGKTWALERIQKR